MIYHSTGVDSFSPARVLVYTFTGDFDLSLCGRRFSSFDFFFTSARARVRPRTSLLNCSRDSISLFASEGESEWHFLSAKYGTWGRRTVNALLFAIKCFATRDWLSHRLGRSQGNEFHLFSALSWAGLCENAGFECLSKLYIIGIVI